MREDWTECCFEDILDYEQPTKYIVNSTDYNDAYEMPVLTAGKSFIKGYTNETKGIFKNLPTIIFDDFTTASQYVDFKFKVKSSAMKILVPTSKLVNMRFAFYCMQVNQIRNDTHKRYWISVYAKKKFLLPSLVEQKAIISKIEELFSDLDKGIDDLTKAKDQLVLYRQAVLKKAFDLDSKKYKIEKICKEIFAGGDKPKDYFSATKTKELPIPIIANAVEKNGLYGYTKTARVIEKAITIAGRGSGTGHVVLRNEPFFPIVRLITIIPNFDIVAIEYLMYFLKNLNIKGSGSAIPQLTIPMVKRFEIYLPSIPIQRQIVKEIESRLSVCEKVEQSINDSLEKAKALRQSILKKAFEGKLLSAAEIARCKQVKDYEPAAVLLAKIKVEKKKSS
ncbi:restriction endonuclease subunit S [Flavobacterium psychrophilum]|nr:restriction endonuclease subunit S [Flavobacterium psychrophilum]